MRQHTDGDQHAGDVGHHPACIRNDRKRCSFTQFIALVVALVERFLGESQRIVHPDRFFLLSDISCCIVDKHR